MAHQHDTAVGTSTNPMRRKLPLLAGAVIAAAGLVLGGIASAVAQQSTGASHSTASAPVHGDSIPNITNVENDIKAYYGAVSGGSATVEGSTVNLTYPDPDGNYAAEMAGIVSQAQSYLSNHLGAQKKQALIFDVDDTTLNTYDYELYANFGYNPTTNADFVNQALFPAVFGMPKLVNWAGAHGYTVFFLTGRPSTQRDGTVQNLKDVGYNVSLATGRLYLKPTSTDPLPTYLPCATISACTTTQYKSATRAHIESLGYHIVADFGDQFSDLNGGYAGHTVKLPNPMYFLP
jgi:predicted secreted acid phosphatase